MPEWGAEGLGLPAVNRLGIADDLLAVPPAAIAAARAQVASRPHLSRCASSDCPGKPPMLSKTKLAKLFDGLAG